MNHVQSKYFDVFYDGAELYASRIGKPCVSPRLAFGLPTLVTHKNIGLLSFLLYQEEEGLILGNRQSWDFPFSHGTLVDLEVARYEFRYVHGGEEFYTIFVTDLGRDILDNTPASFLVRNLISCSTDFSDDRYTDWVRGHHSFLWKAIGFFIRKLAMKDLPEFLTCEDSKIRELAVEALDASV